MKRNLWIVLALGMLASAAACPAEAAAGAAALDTARIERLTGAHGALDRREGVFKVSAPRRDLVVDAGGVRITPAMGLTSWAAFERAGSGTMVMGDMVLREDQVDAVMGVALDNGLEVTALHNHFLGETPRILFMHIGGMGDEAELAGGVGKVLAKIQETSAAPAERPRESIDPAQSTLHPEKLAAILGPGGQFQNGVFKVVVGRTTSMDGHRLGAAMGVNTWAAFAGSDERAVVDGDFAMRSSELQGVIKTLRAAGISIVAIHSHMAGEEPRVLFLHYWGLGRAEDLAKGVQRALALTR